MRASMLRILVTEGARGRELEPARVESLASSGRRVFQPPQPPTLEGYAYRIPVEGSDERDDVAVVRSGEVLAGDFGAPRVVSPDGNAAPLAPELRAVVIAGGALCHAAALRTVMERGTALRFVAVVASDPQNRGVRRSTATRGADAASAAEEDRCPAGDAALSMEDDTAPI